MLYVPISTHLYAMFQRDKAKWPPGARPELGTEAFCCGDGRNLSHLWRYLREAMNSLDMSQ